MNVYKVVFFGTPEIAATILQGLLTFDNVQVVLVVTQPDRIVGRKKILTPSPVKNVALDHHLSVLQPEKVGMIADQIALLEPDFLITCAYGQFIPNKILKTPKIAALNLHGSLLPKYRGGSPIQYAVLNGETTSGMSLMQMVAEMDAGPVYAQKALELAADETSGTLFEKMAPIGIELLKENLDLIATGQLEPIVQDETQVSFAYNLNGVQEKIDWTKNAREIVQFIRALTPTPIAYTSLHNQRYKIGQAEVVSPTAVSGTPGEVLELSAQGIVVQAKSGTIRILEIQRPGKKMLPANLYFHNPNLKDILVGEKFE